MNRRNGFLSPLVGRLGRLAALSLLVLASTVNSDAIARHDSCEALVGHWSLDEGEGDLIFDSTANYNDGIRRGCSWEAGEYGFVLRFNGQEDAVVVPHSQSLMPTEAITLAAWFVIEEPADRYHGIIGKAGYSSGYRLLLSGDAKQVLFQLSAEYSFWASTSVGDGHWHHCVARYDGSLMKLYIDGVALATRAGPERVEVNDDFIVLGGPQYVIHGMVDDVRVYSRALSDEEVARLYETTRGMR